MSRAVVASALALLAACSAARADDTVRLAEFAISAPGGAWSAGARTLTVANDGDFAHTLVVSRSSGQVVTATELIPPGASVEIDVHAGPGSYELTCRIVTEVPGLGIVDHYQRGMRAVVEVAES